MIYNDRVYGKVKITEPVVLELVNCPAIQRLNKIDQAGYKPLWVKPETKVGKFGYNRFTHSVGVYLLLNIYQASLEEQISGLIHDVSHSAFSHAIDYAIKQGSQTNHSYQDDIFESYIQKTDVPRILKKYGFSLKYILEESNFPLKEKNLPDLCADRIDYVLRDALVFGQIDKRKVDDLLKNLLVIEGDWVFKNRKNAENFAVLFKHMNDKYYAGFKSALMFRALGDCLAYALKKKYVTLEDVYKTDEFVVKKIKKYSKSDKYLKKYWLRMNGKTKAKNSPRKTSKVTYCKSRVVDPLFLGKNGIKRLSEVDSNWKSTVEKESKPKKYYIKFQI
jgi:HD superfamily phosphohydrolase